MLRFTWVENAGNMIPLTGLATNQGAPLTTAVKVMRAPLPVKESATGATAAPPLV